MAEYYRVRNWAKFQHYKDRNPPWIKLHQDLLTSEPWVMAPSDSDRYLLIALMLIAARHDNKITANTAYIGKFSHMETEPSFAWPLECGFIEPWVEEQAWQSPWPSRHITNEVKAAVLRRDKNRCVACAATGKLEFDHIIPISKGGGPGEDNVQVLCRSCNRKKRTGLTIHGRSVAPATQPAQRRSLEAEAEREPETKKNKNLAHASRFADFWSVCPKKVGKGRASQLFARACNETSPDLLISAMQRYASAQVGKDPTYIAHPATWLSQRRWEDEDGVSSGATASPEEIAAAADKADRYFKRGKYAVQEAA